MTTSTASPRPAPRLLADRDVRRLFAATVQSKAGVQVGVLALPLVAVLALGASPGEVGLLATLTWAPFLVIGLPAGAWTDRLPRRPTMIVGEMGRAVAIGSVPVAWLADALTFAQLLVVVIAAGTCTVFVDLANLSYLPTLVGRDRLVEANGTLHSIDAVTNVAGRGSAGYLIQWVGAPLALLVTSVAHLVSATVLATIRRRDPPRLPVARPSLLPEVREGVVFVARHPILRAAAVAGAATNLGMQLVMTMLPVLVVGELGLPESRIGLFLAIGGTGALGGAVVARRLGERLGHGRMLWLVGIAIAPAAALVPLIDGGAGLWLAMGGWVVVAAKTAVDNVILVSFRQRVTPDHLLGRQHATMRVLLTGSLAVGAALAGVIGQLAGPRWALWVGSAIMALVWVPIALSPIRRLRELPDAATPIEAPRRRHGESDPC